jgi:hypothetical protein
MDNPPVDVQDAVYDVGRQAGQQEKASTEDMVIISKTVIVVVIVVVTREVAVNFIVSLIGLLRPVCRR